MSDTIEERMKKDQMGRSVIKYWRVRYAKPEEKPEEPEEPEEVAADEEPEEDEAARIAREIYERLQAEAAEDDAKLMAEQEAAYAAAAAAEQGVSDEEAAWRERTGASGVYGQKAFDNEEEAAQVAAILSEKKDAFADMLQNMRGEGS
ncbi:MAG: hypothetical protein IJJ13_09325 [Lachnospiraceae bacterium]|nr:hypothetical protein [Lachnospiraceae bacterium]